MRFQWHHRRRWPTLAAGGNALFIPFNFLLSLAAPYLHGVLVLVTGNKFIGVFVTGNNCSPVSLSPAIKWQGLIAGVIDTAEQLIAGVVDTGDKHHSFANISANFRKYSKRLHLNTWGPGGHWLMKKTWSRKSRVRLPLTNTVSPVRACLSIWLERFRVTHNEDERRPLMQSSILFLIYGPLFNSFLMSFRNRILTESMGDGKVPFQHPYFLLEFGLSLVNIFFWTFFVSREDYILRGPRSSSFWLPRNLSHYIIRQARTCDTMLAKSREITGRTRLVPWLLGGMGVKTTENKIHWPYCLSIIWLKEYTFSSYSE